MVVVVGVGVVGIGDVWWVGFVGYYFWIIGFYLWYCCYVELYVVDIKVFYFGVLVVVVYLEVVVDFLLWMLVEVVVGLDIGVGVGF